MDRFRLAALSAFARVFSTGSRLLNLGAGGTWPGHIALMVDARILRKLVRRKVRRGVILITGTNGKTTSSSILRKQLENDYSVIQNQTGANLENGIVSSLLIAPTADWAVLEVDENVLPIILQSVDPVVVVLLNLFRDQLDRYGEVDAVSQKWLEAMMALPDTCTCVINGDDPQLAFIGQNLRCRVEYFGLGNSVPTLGQADHATDSIHCPRCSVRLRYSRVYFSHLGRWRCPECGFRQPTQMMTPEHTKYPLKGIHNLYNIMAIKTVCVILGYPKTKIEQYFRSISPAFGRMETIVFREKRITLMLSKNPTGFTQSIRTYLAEHSTGPLVIILNDGIADGRDVSWIWDVDVELLAQVEQIVVSGRRAWDLAIRLRHALPVSPHPGNGSLHMDKQIAFTTHVGTVMVKPDIHEALETAVTQVRPEDSVWVLATYTGMLAARKVLTGRKIL